MINATSNALRSNVYGSGSEMLGAGIGYTLRAALRAGLRDAVFPGVSSIRLLPSEERYANAHDKVYFVLSAHDVERDMGIVRVMIQFEGIDYDLVPEDRADLIPPEAAPI